MHKNPVAPRSQRPELLLWLFPSVPSSSLTLRPPPWTPSLLPTLFPLYSHFVPPSSPSVLTSWGRLSAQQDGEGTWGCIRMHVWCLACCVQYVTLSSFGLYEIWFACCVVFIYFQFFSQYFSHFLASEHFFCSPSDQIAFCRAAGDEQRHREKLRFLLVLEWPNSTSHCKWKSLLCCCSLCPL